jgi:hypothetical protein
MEGVMAKDNIEARLAALEAEVEQLKQRLAQAKEPDVPWWQKIAGSFANDPLYEEAMRLGREYRESTGPKPRKRKKSRNASS